jgi:hypothetical protein
VTEFHVAQINVARLLHPLDAAESAEFERALGPVNALAEVTPGFVWRLQDELLQSSSHVRVAGIDDPLTIVNMSVWTDLESLRHFVYRSGHAMYLRRRREWSAAPDGPPSACWWIPAGEIPDPADGYRRLTHLAASGPSDISWPLTSPVDPPH